MNNESVSTVVMITTFFLGYLIFAGLIIKWLLKFALDIWRGK